MCHPTPKYTCTNTHTHTHTLSHGTSGGYQETETMYAQVPLKKVKL